MQKVAVDILQDFETLMMSHGPGEDTFSFEEINGIVERNAEKYALCEDPFTRMLCTSKEAIENRLEYDRQSFEQKYGDCYDDWFD